MAGTRQAPDRSGQRARTRAALIDAAAAILRDGRQPTVAEAAETANVHRATAYRYFPTAGPLLAEAALTARAPDPEALVDGVGDDPEALLDAVVTGFAAFAFREEALVRAALLESLGRWFEATPGKQAGGPANQPADQAQDDRVRHTRRFDYLAPVLDAVAHRLDDGEVARLRSALSLVIGAEAVVATRDVDRLDPAGATVTMRWAARALLRSALADAPDPAPVGPPGDDPTGTPPPPPAPSSVGRPVDHDRRTRLLDAAVDHAAEHGLAELSWRSVATALDVSTTTLVHHFGTKEQLIQAILRRLRTRIGAATSERIGPDADLPTVARAIWATSSDPRHAPTFRLYVAVLGQAVQAPARYGEFLQDTGVDIVDLLRGAQGPDTEPDAATRTADVVDATLRGLLLRLLRGDDPGRVHRAADHFLDGLSTE